MISQGTNVPPVELTLDQVVAHWARQSPDEPALQFGMSEEPHQITWREFDAIIGSLARDIQLTIKLGEAVAVVCSNSLNFHVLINALWRYGASVLLIDRNWGAAIVSDLVRLVGCRTIFVEGESAAANASSAEVRQYPLCEHAESFDSDQDIGPTSDIDGIALYATTSGTTDNPKCVAISHRQIRSAYRACMAVHDFSSVKSCACLFEINSLGVLGICFLLPREFGACTTIYPTFNVSNILATWKLVLNDYIDFIYLVPPLVRLLNTLPKTEFTGRRILAFCSAAPVAEQELRKLETKFPVTAFNVYGLTELTFAVFFGCRAGDGGASESIGYPVNIDAHIVDEAGCVVVGEGKGELLINGPMLTNGYIHNPSATAAVWKDGWLKTGDIAERDSAGRYYIRGREKDVVLRGGYTYYLHELEHYLRRAPGVVDACAFKGRDLPSGDELCVVVQASDGVDANALLEWVSVNMGSTKVPNSLYVWRSGLPRNSNGKIQRNLLVQMHRDGVIEQGMIR